MSATTNATTTRNRQRMNAAEEIWCPRCRAYLPRAEFGDNRLRRDGLDTYCRACKRMAQNAAYQRRVAARPAPATSHGNRRDRSNERGELRCATCAVYLPPDAYTPFAPSADGRQYSCRACRNAQQRAARADRGRQRAELGHQTCRNCGEVKPLDAYAVGGQGGKGRRRVCLTCCPPKTDGSKQAGLGDGGLEMAHVRRRQATALPMGDPAICVHAGQPVTVATALPLIHELHAADLGGRIVKGWTATIEPDAAGTVTPRFETEAAAALFDALIAGRTGRRGR